MEPDATLSDAVVNTPVVSPGANVPPACTDTPAVLVPVPRSVAPEATVTAEAKAPSTASTPPFTAVAPVEVFAPVSVCMPAPTLVSDTTPEPFEITPENPVLVPSPPVVRFRTATLKLVTAPAQAREPTVPPRRSRCRRSLPRSGRPPPPTGPIGDRHSEAFRLKV